MSLMSLTADERATLIEIRDAGSLVLLPEARSFASAESLTRKGLARTVSLRGVKTSTFLLSGEGHAAAGKPSPITEA